MLEVVLLVLFGQYRTTNTISAQGGIVAAPYILARTLKDAHSFAREELGLAKGHYRVVTSPSSISGRRGADIYLVPGYEKRHDRFAMTGALRWTKMNKIDVAELRAEEPVETPDGLEPAGVQPSITEGNPELLAEFEAFLGQAPTESLELTPAEAEQIEEALSDDDTADEPEQAEEPAAEEPAKQTRRRRCKECGALVEPDDLEQHLADHLPSEE